MNQIYGYCRISTYKQNIERQERNIKTLFPEAVIIKEVFTGTQENRPEWRKLYRHVDRGDIASLDFRHFPLLLQKVFWSAHHLAVSFY